MRFIGSLLVLLMLAAACGDPDPSEMTSTTVPAPVALTPEIRGSDCASWEPGALCEAGEPYGFALEEQWGARGVRVLAPSHWESELSDGGGSGSSSLWTNPRDEAEFVYAVTGVSAGAWWEIDGIEGSITPMVSDTADVYRLFRTVFVYVDAIDDIAVVGVWRVTPSYDGDDCCYKRAEIGLRYDNPSNEDLWNKFLKHQLQEVVGTDIEVRFSRRSLQHRFS